MIDDLVLSYIERGIFASLKGFDITTNSAETSAVKLAVKNASRKEMKFEKKTSIQSFLICFNHN